MAKAILVIEDDPRQLRLAQDLIKMCGYVVLTATDGEKGIELAKKHRPDLILMDILMPKLDGYTACYEIKRAQATKAIPVVMLTGIAHELNKKLAGKFGADGYVAKPFNLQELLDKVKRYESAACPVGSWVDRQKGIEMEKLAGQKTILETTTRDFLNKTKVPYIAKPFNIEQLNREINRILTKGM